MYNIYVSTMQISKAFRTYNNMNQVTRKGASILNLMDIDENILQKIFKCFQSQQNFNGSTFEVSKEPNIQLTIACKKTTIDVKLNKKHKRNNGDGFFTLVFGFCQFPKSSKKIEINGIAITNRQKGDGNAKINHKSGHGDGRVLDLKYFLQT